MAKVHWTVYILIGLFISIMSWKLNYEKFIFFFYAGWVFVLVGTVKLIFSWIKNRTSKELVRTKQPQTTQYKTLHRQTPQSNIKFCHNCGAALRLQHRFCIRCGARA
mgnify:CR=1 FL=1